MSFISQRGKEYLETAQTLLRAAQTMTDSVIAGQLKALADDYERRAEKASHADAAKALARSAARVDRDGQAYEPEVPMKVREWIGLVIIPSAHRKGELSECATAPQWRKPTPHSTAHPLVNRPNLA